VSRICPLFCDSSMGMGLAGKQEIGKRDGDQGPAGNGWGGEGRFLRRATRWQSGEGRAGMGGRGLYDVCTVKS